MTTISAEQIATGFAEVISVDSTPTFEVSAAFVEAAIEETSPTIYVTDIFAQAIITSPTNPEYRVGTVALYYSLSTSFITDETFSARNSSTTPFDQFVLKKSPDLVTGYRLDPNERIIGIIEPEETENLILNPSFETGTTGYSSDVSIITRVEEGSRGLYAAQVQPASGLPNHIKYEITIASGQYTFSFDIKSSGGRYRIYVIDSTLTRVSGYKYIEPKNRWQRYNYTFSIQTSADYYLIVDQLPNGRTWLTDGWQLEAKSYTTTYVDGDYAPGYWTGERSNSTSVRPASDRQGGKINWIDAEVLNVIGLGMAPVEPISTAISDGSEQYRTSIKRTRDFTILFKVWGENLPDLQKRRQEIIDLIKPDKSFPYEEFILVYRPPQYCGFDVDWLEIPCVYMDGLSGDFNNFWGEELTVTFRSYRGTLNSPFWNVERITIPSAGTGNLLIRHEDDSTELLASSITGNGINCALVQNRSKYIVGGDFSAIEAVSADNIAQYDDGVWTELAGGLNGVVHDIAVSPDETTLYIVGAFTSANGGATTVRYFAMYTTAGGWVEPDTGFNATARAVDVHPNGQVFISGDFTAEGGGGALYYIAKYDPGTDAISAYTNQLDDIGKSVHVAKDGKIYFGGEFTSDASGNVRAIAVASDAGASSVSEAGDGVTFSSTGVHAITSNENGTPYIAGDILLNGTGDTVQRIAYLRGDSTWQTVAGGFNTGPSWMFFDAKGKLRAGGAFNPGFNGYGDYGTLYGAKYNGTLWLPEDYYGGSITTGKAHYRSESMTTAIPVEDPLVGISTTITSYSTTKVYPIVLIRGAGRLHSLANLDTGVEIFFDLLMYSGEGIEMYTKPGEARIESDYRGNLINSVLVGASNLSNFFLLPGENRIRVVASSIDGLAMLFLWQNEFWSLDSGYLI